VADRAVVSGEGVALELPRAGIGSRLIATVLDLLAQLFTFWIVLVVDGVTAGGSDDAATAALVIVEFVLIFGGYPIVCEWLTRGRTLGKLALGLRVVRDDGGPIAFRHALVRGISSLVLEKPGITAGITAAAGFITAVFSEQDKRIADMLAGTFVLNERAGTSRPVLGTHWGTPPQLLPWTAALDLTRLDDRLAQSVRQFLTRAPVMTGEAQYALAHQLATAVCAVTAPPPPPGVPAMVLLHAVLDERRRRAAGWSGWAPGPYPAQPSGSAPMPAPPPAGPPASPPPGPQAGTPPGPPPGSSPAGPFAPPS